MPEASSEIRARDLEEQQRMMKERVLLVSKTFVDERERLTGEINSLQKKVILLATDMQRMQEIVKNITEQINKTARREEVATIQRQVDLLRTWE
jgi:hypothetical protein